MSALWYVGQAGIVIEAVGAGLGVWFAWQTKAHWGAKPAATTYNSLGDDIAGPRAEFIGQFTKQATAFALIGAGLVLQFFGNFGK